MTNPKVKPRTGRGNSGKSPVIGDNGIMTDPGDNTKYARLTHALSTWPPIDKTNVTVLEQRLSDYLYFCMENDLKVGNMMCYLALGISKEDARDWAAGARGSPAHRVFIEKVKAICSGVRECLMQDGKINPVTGIFWQKNHDGFRDVQDIAVVPNNPLGELDTPEQIEARKQKYLDAIPPEEE